jgi:DNA-directed RNA polymerase specialized sigma24 family protein
MKTQKEIDEENGIIDAALIVLIKEGDKKAEGTLFMLRKNKLYRIAFGYYKNKEDAEDAMMEAFETTIDTIMDGTYIEDNCYERYLCKILKNKFLNGIDIDKKRILVPLDIISELPETLSVDNSEDDEKVAKIKMILLTFSKKMTTPFQPSHYR